MEARLESKDVPDAQLLDQVHKRMIEILHFPIQIVLKHLRQRGYSEAEKILSREAHLNGNMVRNLIANNCIRAVD